MSEWPLEHAGDKKGVKKLLEGKFETNPEVLWRLARSYFDILDGLTKATKLDQKRLCEKAFDTIKLALEEGGENNFAVHKWYGIILNKLSEFQGSTATIQNSFIVKEHWETAAALNPSDPTSCSLLGEWCLAVAGVCERECLCVRALARLRVVVRCLIDWHVVMLCAYVDGHEVSLTRACTRRHMSRHFRSHAQACSDALCPTSFLFLRRSPLCLSQGDPHLLCLCLCLCVRVCVGARGCRVMD
jgi:hypothetical protein